MSTEDFETLNKPILDDLDNYYQETIENSDHSLSRLKKSFFIILSITIFLELSFLFLYTVKHKEYSGKIAQAQAEKVSKKAAWTSDVPDFETTIANDFEQFSAIPAQTDDTYEVALSSGSIQIDRENIFLSDNAHVLDQTVKRRIYELNRELNDLGTGAQLMVVTILSLPEDQTIESYATEIFNTLGIGSKEYDNGVLYLLSVGDKKTRIEVGYGLEAILTDAQAQAIVDDQKVIKDYQNNDYADGVLRTITLIAPFIDTHTPREDFIIRENKRNLATLKNGYSLAAIGLVLPLLILAYLWSSFSKGRQFIETTYETTKKFVLTEDVYKYQAYQRLLTFDFYCLMLTGSLLGQTYRSILKRRDLGKLLAKFPNASLLGNYVLSGDRLYDHKGRIVTDSYSTSRFNSNNHHFDDSSNGSSGSGGSFGGGNSSGGSGGSFGGGSSGGGGASGGW